MIKDQLNTRHPHREIRPEIIIPEKSVQQKVDEMIDRTKKSHGIIPDGEEIARKKLTEYFLGDRSQDVLWFPDFDSAKHWIKQKLEVTANDLLIKFIWVEMIRIGNVSKPRIVYHDQLSEAITSITEQSIDDLLGQIDAWTTNDLLLNAFKGQELIDLKLYLKELQNGLAEEDSGKPLGKILADDDRSEE